ncbi:MAG: hypothetical protein N2316_05930 [Spirochaetes bacterium]|nr:hypothetical protein [Spirochaetota bacterium]
MDIKSETITIVKTIRMLEGVYKTSPNATQRARVKKELDQLRKKLAELYPGEDIKAIEEAFERDFLAKPIETQRDFSEFETLRDVEIQNFSPYRDDREINEAASLLVYFQERIWGAISDQHTKLDYSNANERDALYRKLDQCNRSFKIYLQTIEDIEKAKSGEYLSQLNIIRSKQARILLFDIHDFFKSVSKFLTNVISETEYGGSMILNPQELMVYAEYEKYATFQGKTVLFALKYMKQFVSEALQVIKVPEIKKSENV